MQQNIFEMGGYPYDKAFKVFMSHQENTLDSFECVINKISPHCTSCKTLLKARGVESGNQVFCCSHCAQSLGFAELVDFK